MPKSLTQELQTKYNTLLEILESYKSVAVAYSGGVDSTLVLKVAADQLQDTSIGYFVNSQVQPLAEKEAAISVAHHIGCNFEIVEADLFSFDTFLKNPIDRCYHCKKMIFSTLQSIASKAGHSILLDGSNVDDQYQHRPGAKAIKELGVKSPLLEANLNKNEIRQISKYLQLATWNKLSASCLATRIPPNYPITKKDLQRIEQGETYLHKLGYLGCRLRLQDTQASLELINGDIVRLINKGDIDRIKKHFSTLEIEKVLLDLSEREGVIP